MLNRDHVFRRIVIQEAALPRGIAHDPEKHALGLDPRVGTGFRIRSCADSKDCLGYHSRNRTRLGRTAMNVKPNTQSAKPVEDLPVDDLRAHVVRPQQMLWDKMR